MEMGLGAAVEVVRHWTRTGRLYALRSRGSDLARGATVQLVVHVKDSFFLIQQHLKIIIR